MSLLYAEVFEERHRLGGQVGDVMLQILLAPDVEGDGAEVPRERENLLESPPTPETEPPDQEQRRAVAVDIVVYAGVVRDHHGHNATSTFFRPLFSYRPAWEPAVPPGTRPACDQPRSPSRK